MALYLTYTSLKNIVVFKTKSTIQEIHQEGLAGAVYKIDKNRQLEKIGTVDFQLTEKEIIEKYVKSDKP
jgi:hypothetical protein